MITRKQIENYLISHKGYLKISSLNVAKKIWKSSSKHTLPKNAKELQKELDLIKEVQSNLRKAVSIETEVFDNGLIDIYQKILDEKNRPKKLLYVDIEVSPSLVFTWNIGQKISLSPDNIVKERAIICICFKWANEDKVHSLKWDAGDDYQMLKKFAPILNSCDAVIGHNLKNFDLKWVKTRCLYHDIEVNKQFQVIDTLTLSRSNFRFNSNRLDYISKFLGETGKKETSYSLWKDIVLGNCKKSMDTMVEYCINDVKILQEVHEKINKYVPEKKLKFRL